MTLTRNEQKLIASQVLCSRRDCCRNKNGVCGVLKLGITPLKFDAYTCEHFALIEKAVKAFGAKIVEWKW